MFRQDFELTKLVVVGLNDFACITVQWCKENGVEPIIFSGKRFHDRPSLLGQYATCHQWMEAMGEKVNELERLRVEDVRDHAGPSSLMFSFDSPFIISQPVIDLFKGRVLNEHGANLPHGRGGGGFSWRIMENDRRGYVCFHCVVDAIDAGPVLYKEEFIFPNECRKPIQYDKYQMQVTMPALRRFLGQVKYSPGSVRCVEQDESFAVYFPRLHTPTHAFIDWNWDVRQIERFILAFSDPYEGAKTFVGESKVYIRDCFVEEGGLDTHPYKYGIVVNIRNGNPCVVCRGGLLVIKEYKFEKDAVRFQAGDRLHTARRILDEGYASRVFYDASGLRGK